MNDITIPFYFLDENHIVLSAKEVDYAIRYELIYLKDLGKIVDVSLVKYPNDGSLLELALDFLLDNFCINTDVSNDVELESDLVSSKWRYILLLWLYENRKGSTTDYDRINIIYADFGYPLDMERFISYMPAHDDYETLGYQNILNNWNVYLNTYKYLIES
ncbi:DUF2247 family protein [Psychrobacter aquaticus]|uniref:DUF2247 family protein n=1 Tax=Psychrobacter aquaticus TaxID=248452 RepID=UPI00058F162D|nr:DUF2247 family protein [Psychrobacter aquaticus]